MLPSKCPYCGDSSQLKIFDSGDSSQSLDFGCESCGHLFIIDVPTWKISIWSEDPEERNGSDDIGDWIPLETYLMRRHHPFIFR